MVGTQRAASLLLGVYVFSLTAHPLIVSPFPFLCEIKDKSDFVFARKERKERRDLFSFVFHAGAGGVVNFVTTRGRREFIHPLPPTGYSPLSQGENGPPQSPCRGRSQSQPTCAHTILTVPLRQGRRAKRRGWIVIVIVIVFARHRFRHRHRFRPSSSSFSSVNVNVFRSVLLVASSWLH